MRTVDKSIGIDVCVKNYATIYDGINITKINHFKDFNKYKSLKDKVIKMQQIISHKAEINYNLILNLWMDKHPCETPNDKEKNIMKGKAIQNLQH